MDPNILIPEDLTVHSKTCNWSSIMQHNNDHFMKK